MINELKFTEYDTFALSFANHEAMTNAMTSVFSDIYAEMQGPSDLIAQFLMGQHYKTVPEKVHAPPVSAPTPPATRKKPTPSKVKLLPNEEVPGTTSEAANDDSDFVPPTKSSTAEHEDTKMLAKKYPGIKMTPSEKKNPVRSLYRAKEQLMQLKETHEEQVKILKQQLLTANNQLKHLQKALRVNFRASSYYRL